MAWVSLSRQDDWCEELALRFHDAIHGSPAPRAKGLVAGPEARWGPALERVPPKILVRAVASVLRTLLLPEYAQQRPHDRSALRAVEAAEAWLAEPSMNRALHAKAVAKVCTQARKDTLGSEHRIAEAARAVATAVTRTSDDVMRCDAVQALASVEEHLLYRRSAGGEHDRQTNVREQIAEALGTALRSEASGRAAAPRAR